MQDGLTYEEMKPYITRVMHKTKDVRVGHADDNLDEADWMTYSTALLLKSMLEFENHRTMCVFLIDFLLLLALCFLSILFVILCCRERAVLQMQALADQHTTKLTPMQFSQKVVDESAPAAVRPSLTLRCLHTSCSHHVTPPTPATPTHVQERLRYVYNLVFPSRWDFKRQLADKYMKMYVVRSALDLYEGLEMWDDMIECYVILGVVYSYFVGCFSLSAPLSFTSPSFLGYNPSRLGVDKVQRAKRLVRHRLAVSPSPRLWCVLGGLLDKDWPYNRAWEVSNQRSLCLDKKCYHRP